MAKYTYLFNTGHALDADIWAEASVDELRVLTYLLTKSTPTPEDEIAKACGITAARTKSALALWREAGMLVRKSDEESAEATRGADPTAPRVTYEFEPSVGTDPTDEAEAVEVAHTIRNASLAELMSDVALLLGKAALNQLEAKQLSSIYEQLGLSGEYIVTLATYMSEHAKSSGKRFTVRLLLDRCSALTTRGIDNLEALETYIEAQEKNSGYMYELRRLFGIWNRNFSKTEEEAFNKWADEYGYGIGIITEAYDVMVGSINKFSISYMKKLIDAWHAAGVKTVADVREYVEGHRAELAGRAVAQKEREPKRSGARKAAQTPLYSAFDSEDALMRALERSYGEEDKD